ncbi:hypothetical protein STRDD10_01777 [Streptococcus sp. DD10]|uniref:class B sortase, LPKTxAVK-specific n=1 Tax=Streptococcus sp. DD10 TaxID=1777878 RepID=UPI000797C74D|nr:class B sortase, LPKTxAVK-specific [Streptococcus sp. DD10]KXT72714.1 hypothetical protein STRDD10_01777 [Streptococcus sp. DD10]
MNKKGGKSLLSNKKMIGVVLTLLIAFLGIGLTWFLSLQSSNSHASKSVQTSQSNSITQSYSPTAEEKEYLTNKFSGLVATNPETVAYVYAPGTELDEPVVQTTDNATYLDKTFDGGNEPLMGTVFMDKDNHKDFNDRLTWLFGHARGSKVADHRMFNDVNYYSDQTYFNEHKYVVIETPERKYYYEALAMVIVPETTAFYRTEFTDDTDFKEQLDTIYETASVKNADLKINPQDKYLVLSTCREEDDTIRANLYLRQIPDSEMADFVTQHGENLTYKPTRS